MKHGLIFNHWFEVFYHCVDHTCLNAEPGVTSSIPARSHSFVEIDHEIISTAIFLPSADSRRVGSFMSVLSFLLCFRAHLLCFVVTCWERADLLAFVCDV